MKKVAKKTAKKIVEKIFRYKLTDQEMMTYGSTEWTLGKWKKTNGKGRLCSSGWLHCYSDPLLAVLLNPIHAQFYNPRLFKAEVAGKTKKDHGRKEGWSNMRLVEEMKLPAFGTDQLVRFAIFCALEVSKDRKFIRWAKNWLNGTDRTLASASATYNDAWLRDTLSAESYAASAASRAQERAREVPEAVAGAAVWAVENSSRVNLVKLAKKALEQDA
jgi:hypothetical protein